MKAIVTFSLFFILIGLAQAYVINITADKSVGLIGEQVTATIVVKNQHLSCLLDINQTEITVKGATIVNQTDWKKTAPLQYEKSITVKLIGPDQATINVKRSCNIKSVENSIVITVKSENQSNKFVTTVTNVKATTTMLLNNLSALATYRTTLKTLVQSEKDQASRVKINKVIAQLDSTIKYSKEFARQCFLLLN